MRLFSASAPLSQAVFLSSFWPNILPLVVSIHAACDWRAQTVAPAWLSCLKMQRIPLCLFCNFLMNTESLH
jgi:hypothetical protein